MKNINNLLKLVLILSFTFADECRLIENQDDCIQTEGCYWNEDLNYCQSYDDDDWEDEEEIECEGLSEEDCEWLDYCVWDDEGNECYNDEDGEEDAYIHQRPGWWESEPNVGRVAHGIPNRVHRLKALGNSLVPMIPYIIGKSILETYNG